MANEVDIRDPLVLPPGIFKWGNTVFPVAAAIDTADEAVTLVAGEEGVILAVVGMILVVPNSESFILMSGSSTDVYIPLQGNSGQWKGVSDEILYMTQPGEDLRLTTEVSEGSPNGAFLFYVAKIQSAA